MGLRLFFLLNFPVAMIIIFLTFSRGYGPFLDFIEPIYVVHISIRYKWGYAYSFCQIFQRLCLMFIQVATFIPDSRVGVRNTSSKGLGLTPLIGDRCDTVQYLLCCKQTRNQLMYE